MAGGKEGLIDRVLAVWRRRHLHPYDKISGKTILVDYKEDRFSRWFDKYANAEGSLSAEDLPRTTMGGVLSLIFGALVAVLLATGIYKLSSQNTTIVTGDQIVFNLDCVGTPAKCSAPEEDDPLAAVQDAFWPYGDPIDLPALDLTVSSRLEFYETSGRTSLHKIRVVDKMSVHSSLLNHHSAVPKVRAVKDSFAVRMNSWHKVSGPLSSPTENIERGMHEMMASSASHQFDETLKHFYAENDRFSEFEEDMFDHNVVAFFRFDKTQLRELKPCQLQVGLVNTAEFKILEDAMIADRIYQSPNYTQTLATDSFTWTTASWDSRTKRWSDDLTKGTNVVLLKSSYTRAQLAAFKNTTAYGPLNVNVRARRKQATTQSAGCTDFTKAGEASFDSAYWVAATPTKNQTVLQLTNFRPPKNGNAPPFFVLMVGDAGMERMKVVKLNNTAKTMTVERGGDIDTAITFNISRPTSYPPTPPAAWRCHPADYLDGSTCHCYDVGQVSISEDCVNLALPGETVLLGYIGPPEGITAAGGCQACPYEKLYDGASVLNDHGEYVCQYKALGHINGKNVLTEFNATNDAFGANLTAGGLTNQRRTVRVALGASSKLPTTATPSNPYYAALDSGQGNQELARVLTATEPDGRNEQIVTIESTTSTFRFMHFSSGKLVSALSEDFTDMIMFLDSPDHPFPRYGSHTVQIDATQLTINTATKTQGRDVQRLGLTVPPAIAPAGYRSRTVAPVTANLASFHDDGGGPRNIHPVVFPSGPDFIDSAAAGSCLSIYAFTDDFGNSYCDGIHDGRPSGGRIWRVLIQPLDIRSLQPHWVAGLGQGQLGDGRHQQRGERSPHGRRVEFPKQEHFPGSAFLGTNFDPFNDDHYNVRGFWKCAIELWLDGTCDCNCGRYDPDCAGDTGIPEDWLQAQGISPGLGGSDYDDKGVMIECPDGDAALVNVDGANIQCATLRDMRATYPYCSYPAGIPTAVRANAWNGLEKLWEVIVLDSPLKNSRSAGVVVETLAIDTHASSTSGRRRLTQQASATADYDSLFDELEPDPRLQRHISMTHHQSRGTVHEEERRRRLEANTTPDRSIRLSQRKVAREDLLDYINRRLENKMDHGQRRLSAPMHSVPSSTPSRLPRKLQPGGEDPADPLEDPAAEDPIEPDQEDPIADDPLIEEPAGDDPDSDFEDPVVEDPEPDPADAALDEGAGDEVADPVTGADDFGGQPDPGPAQGGGDPLVDEPIDDPDTGGGEVPEDQGDGGLDGGQLGSAEASLGLALTTSARRIQ
ncbi:unnamed protein product [Vitrella brassicaformis CCMP3155]|uniref:Uncharacterized protein n=2 Tax=Vitrella brassicaformis TaxID=1169539 RepID=A0A0G4GKL0_VITBC|nr:unnamed protein product [Vitrella brassicaformis CCMP3155]|eukprot:CEM30546.1 unnamed protein product [Vitrella brassicaformis CCMP3155]